MKTTKEIFLRSMDLFKRMRIQQWEKEYAETHKDEESDLRIQELHNKLMPKLTEETRNMLVEYVDLLVAKYNTNGGYFYDKGFSESFDVMVLFKDAVNNDLLFPPLDEEDTLDIESLL